MLFDCIEFSEDLRFIDVMSDVAFLVMDFRDRGRPDFANRFLNAYLEITGDYEGLRVLRFYVVYRALVRAMVACERARQVGLGAAADADLALAANTSSSRRKVLRPAMAADRDHPRLFRLRQDDRRPRVSSSGMARCASAPTSSASACTTCGPPIATRRDSPHRMYSDDVTRWVYLRVLALARGAVIAGYVAIAGRTFLKRWQRRLFQNLASELGVPFVIVSFDVSRDTLQARVHARGEHGRDASDADLDVLESQLRTHEPLDADERMETVRFDNEISFAGSQSPERWGGVVERIACQRGERLVPQPTRADRSP